MSASLYPGGHVLACFSLGPRALNLCQIKRVFLGQRRPWVKGHGCHCYVHCTLKQDLTSYSFFMPFLCLVRLFYWWNRSQRNPKWIHKRASRSNQKTLSFGGTFPCPGVDQEESVSVNLSLASNKWREVFSLSPWHHELLRNAMTLSSPLP